MGAKTMCRDAGVRDTNQDAECAPSLVEDGLNVGKAGVGHRQILFDLPRFVDIYAPTILMCIDDCANYREE